MFMIDYVKRDEAEGKIAELYSMIPDAIGIPAPFFLFSASPGIFERQADIVKYFSGHDAFEFHILAAIRYMVASLNDFKPCVEFNGRLLMAAGVKPEELEIIAADPVNAPFEERECRLLAFVKKGVAEPESIGRDDIDCLIDMGWKESDLVDALYQGASMNVPGILVKAFSKK